MASVGVTIRVTEERPTRTSELLRQLAGSMQSERVTLREIVDALGDRGLGVLIAVFAIPNIIPSPIPFGNVFFGLLAMVFCIHLMLGVRHLVLPDYFGRRSIRTATFKPFAARMAQAMAKFERLLRPRLPVITHAGPERFIGAIGAIFALVCALPIPLAHNIPAIGLTLIGLGLIERDGHAIIVGLAVGALGVALFGLVLFGLAAGLSYLAM